MEIRIPLNNTLREGSKNYYSNVLAYKTWNDAHDPKQKIAKYLSKKLNGKNVLDMGCGNGKYADLLTARIGSQVWNYAGIDISKPQLKLAKQRIILNDHVRFYQQSAEKTKFRTNSFDAVISVWGAMSVVKDLRRKKKILIEAERILVPNGSVYIVRDDFGGEWVKIKRRQKSRRGYNWLFANGFKVVHRLTTCFDFESPEQAKEVMHSLFGRKVSAFIKTKRIEHKVMILKKVKEA